MLGIVWRKDVLDLYNTKVRSMELTGSFADIISGNDEEGMQVMEITQ
ncbi:MAG: hypothetical protein PF637_00430 [Spirochaetes bacterium]|nr:hypothetical protein [Spirochaetota bacterium]